MLDRYYRFKNIAGINIEIDREGKAAFSACVLKIEGNNVVLEKKISIVQNISEILKSIPLGAPVCINITGRGVLTKEIVTSSAEPVTFANILPNADAGDFYTQEFTSGAKLFLSIIRKKDADSWISKFTEQGFNLVVLSLGPFVANQVLPQLNIYDTEFHFDGHQVLLNNKREWLNVNYAANTKSKYPYKLEHENIAEALILPYAAAFQLVLYPNINLISCRADPLHQKLNLLIENRKFRTNGAVVLVVIFTLLFFNFFLFSHYTSSNAILETQVGQSEFDAGKTQLFADSIKTKKALLDSLGWEGKIRKSVLLDQLAQSLPADIYWQQVSVDAVEKDASGQNKLKYAARQISITGTSGRILPVNEWVARIKVAPWVKDVQLRNYAFNSEQNTGHFTITIAY